MMQKSIALFQGKIKKKKHEEVQNQQTLQIKRNYLDKNKQWDSKLTNADNDKSVCFIVSSSKTCFVLHCVIFLRVEFQNKFYHGTGVKFVPFDFSRLPSVFEQDGLL